MEGRVPEDQVNHPSHYATGPVECIEAIQASMTADQFVGYCKGNIFKYLWRMGNKKGSTTDHEKAQWYMNKLVDTINNGIV
jgi:hypothetical protein